MFQRFRERFARFMVGRYGIDDFGRFLLGCCMAAIVLNWLFKSQFLTWLELALIIYSYFRMFSKNTYKRYQENESFLQLKRRFLGRFDTLKRGGNPFSGFGKSANQDPTKKIFKCPGCGQKVRVPKGRGTIMITCPKCKCQFQKRT